MVLEGRSASDWGISEAMEDPAAATLLAASLVLTQPCSIQHFFMGTVQYFWQIGP